MKKLFLLIVTSLVLSNCNVPITVERPWGSVTKDENGKIYVKVIPKVEVVK